MKGVLQVECKRFTQLFQWILKKWKILPYEIWSWYRKSCSCSLDAWCSRDECTCGLNGPWPSLPAADLEKVAPWHRLWRFPSAAEKWSEIPWIFPHEFHEFRRDYGLAMNWVTASQSVLGIPYGQLLVTSLLRPPQCTCITNSDAVDEEA